MNRLAKLLASLFVFVPGLTFAAGFSGGDEFTAHNAYGVATVWCRDNFGSHAYTVQCSTNFLAPYEYDRFVTDEEIDADKVTITRTTKKGKLIKKDEKYSKSKKQSGHFNLWIASLTQKPLLDYGTNVLTYQMTKMKNVVKEGEFTVEVVKGKDLKCRHESINYFGHCPMGQAACSDYFARTVCK